jgi:hypothetical protein
LRWGERCEIDSSAVKKGKKHKGKIPMPELATIAGSELASARWERLSLNARIEQLKKTHQGVRNMWANMTPEERSAEMKRRAAVREENKRKRQNPND